MITLSVNLNVRTYPIYIGSHILTQSLCYQPHIAGTKVAIVSNQNVAPLYADKVTQTLTQLNKKVFNITLPDGEAFKNGDTLNAIFDQLLAAQANRHTTLIALGGGVIGDITGFAAACYMRGIPFLQIPTTLLAQVDSSVGGKTSINHPLGKNMIGAFYQPKAVIVDTRVLSTLPRRELIAGLAEVIKYGVIADADFFAWIEQHVEALLACDNQALSYAIQRSCEIKAAIVAQDEYEQNIRAILNFGHTFGHAIEAGLGYGTWLHGEAVACGMVIATALSCHLGLIPSTLYQRVRRLLQACHLPVVAPALGIERYLELMATNKKNTDNTIRFILLSELGKAQIRTAPTEAIIRTLQEAIQAPAGLG